MADTATTATALSIKDYIIDIESNKQKPAIAYEVALENNTDFIVRRQTKTNQRELVILISQGLFYVRDCKTGAVDPVTSVNLRSFFRDLKENDIELQQVKWLHVLNRYVLDFILTVIEDADLIDMCRHNVPIDPMASQKYVRYWQQNKKLFIRIAQMFPKQRMVGGKYANSIPAIFWTEQRYGANEAMYFAEKLAQSGLRDISYGKTYYSDPHCYSPEILDFTKILDAGYNINFRRFIDYICFDLYRQGYGQLDCSFFAEYRDYLEMQIQFYGKVREKYPENFKTAHDVIALKVNQMRETQQCVNFSEQVEAVKDLEYSGQGYCIVVPAEPQELADEGINLSHCVGSYIGRVASGECQILFLRRKNTPEQSLVTLQLNGRCICQAQGINQRSITDQERAFLHRWGREKNIKIAV